MGKWDSEDKELDNKYSINFKESLSMNTYIADSKLHS